MGRFHGDWTGGDQTTVLEVLKRRLGTDPDGPYLGFVDGDAMFSAAQVDATSDRVAAGLSELGVEHGDRVATLLETSPEGIFSWFGAIKLGAISVPINTAYKGEFLAHQLRDSGSKVLVIQADLLARLEEIADKLSDLEAIVVTQTDAPPALPGAGARLMGWSELVDSTDTPPEADVGPGDIATFIYTAGTTGPSKGCMLSQNYCVELARQIGISWSRRPEDVVWTSNPLFHFNAISVCVVGCLLWGGRAWLSKRFSVSRFWETMNHTQASVASLLGSSATLIAAASDDPQQKENDSLRLMVAVPMPPEIDAIYRERFGVTTFSGGFGLTECSLISWLPGERPNRPGAAGILNTEAFEVILLDDAENEVPLGEPGEIAVRPKKPFVMFEGYWGRPETTVSVSRNWWFHTGDVGRIDAEGYLYFVDRKKDCLRRRGENISSYEMENTFLGHPAIAEVAVHAVPSEISEDDVKVTAVLKEGVTLSEEELCRWAIERVPFYAVPRYIEFRDTLPRNPVGRPLKYKLCEEGVTPRTFDSERAGIEFERR